MRQVVLVEDGLLQSVPRWRRPRGVPPPRGVLYRSGELSVDANKIEAAERLDDKGIPMTHDVSLTPEQIATSYRAMGVIERCVCGVKRARSKHLVTPSPIFGFSDSPA